MQTISQYVWSIVSKDNIAIEYLKNGLLNTTAYAKLIRPRIESQTLTKVSISSVVTSLARIKQKLNSNINSTPGFKIDDISLKFPITELVYRKDHNPNPDLSVVYSMLESKESIHFNLVNVADEIDIFVSTGQATLVEEHMKNFKMIIKETDLSAIILKYNPEFRNYPGIGAGVLNILAMNSINLIECLTTYSEFIIYISQDSANQAIQILKEAFMS